VGDCCKTWVFLCLKEGGSMIVQIYEIQTPEEAEKCISLGVDHIGSVILSEKDRRLSRLREVVRLAQETGARSSLIPLFKQEDLLLDAMEYYRPDFIHLCDSLTDENGGVGNLGEAVRVQKILKQEFPDLGIIRSIPIPRQGIRTPFPTLEIAHELEPVTDFFLTDTWLGREPVEGFIGITGQEADWVMAEELVRKTSIPVILAGGLSPENVRGALLKVLPFGADSCTRTNRMDAEGKPVRFEKDFARVEVFVQEVREAEKTLTFARKELRRKLTRLTIELKEREAALPAHSVRPHQLLAVETLEDEIALVKKEIDRLEEPPWKLR
jgi:phosphoribosylanthranilate isomerase